MHSCYFQKSQRRYYSLTMIFIYLGGVWGEGGNQEGKQRHRAAETQWHSSEEHTAMLSCSAKKLNRPARSQEIPLTRGKVSVPLGHVGAKYQKNPGKTVKHSWDLLVWNRGDRALESNILGNLRK